jgi:hypothetical protein
VADGDAERGHERRHGPEARGRSPDTGEQHGVDQHERAEGHTEAQDWDAERIAVARDVPREGLRETGHDGTLPLAGRAIEAHQYPAEGAPGATGDGGTGNPGITGTLGQPWGMGKLGITDGIGGKTMEGIGGGALPASGVAAEGAPLGRDGGVWGCGPTSVGTWGESGGGGGEAVAGWGSVGVGVGLSVGSGATGTETVGVPRSVSITAAAIPAPSTSAPASTAPRRP